MTSEQPQPAAPKSPRPKSPPIPKQTNFVKWLHGLNILSLFIMSWSGLRIYNANPVFGGRAGWHFPSWATLGGGLAGARDWHFAAMWFFALNLLIYGIYIGLTRRWKKRFVAASDLQVIKTGQNPKRKTYAWHRLAYTAIIPVLLLAIATGLAMYKPAQLAWLSGLFINWQILRTLHFLTIPVALIFLVTHIVLSVKAGGGRLLQSMFR